MSKDRKANKAYAARNGVNTISALGLICCILSACQQNDASTLTSISASPTPTTTPTTTPGVGGGQGTGGTVTATAGSATSPFTVTAAFTPLTAGTPVTSVLHEQSSITSPCTIAAGTTVGSAASNLYCILDVAEEDLYANAVTLSFNSPQGMCPYTAVKLYSFYQYNPGPVGGFTETIGVYEDDTANPATQTVTYPNPVPTTVQWSGGAVGGTPICPYDYSANGGPNCCEGSATVTTTTASNPNAPTTTITQFTGNRNNCISGPDPDIFKRSTITNAPLPELYQTLLSGLGLSITLASPISNEYSSNLYVANYFNPFDFGDNQQLQPPTASNFYPAGIPETGPTSPYYEFSCTDSAADTIARIRLLIRPWDRVTDFTTYANPYTSGAPNPIDPGTEPTFGGPYHDLNVWYDLSPSNPSFSSSYIGLGL